MRFRRSARLVVAAAALVVGAPSVLAAPAPPPVMPAAVRERLLDEVAEARGLVDRLRARLGSRLGPTYYADSPAGDVFTVGVIGRTDADVRLVQSMVGVPGLVEVRGASYTTDQVLEFARRLGRRMDTAGLRYSTIGVELPLLPERVVVTTASELAEHHRQALRAAVPVRVEFRVGAPLSPRHGVNRTDYPPYEAALELSVTYAEHRPVHERLTRRCSSGFTAYSQTTRSYYGTTAGHCGPTRSKVRMGLADSEASGKIDENGYYDNGGGMVYSDSARFPIRAGDITKGVIARGAYDHLLPIGVDDMLDLFEKRHGKRLCLVGVDSPVERCGILDAVYATANMYNKLTDDVPPGPPPRTVANVFCMSMTDRAGMTFGDSGAPVYHVNASGVTHASGMAIGQSAPTSDHPFPRVCFQALDELEERLDVEILYDGWVDPDSELDGQSTGPGMSADASHVMFTSQASNLVPGDRNGQADVFVRDLVDRVTVRVSVTSNGGEGNGYSWGDGITGDGRFVLFTSNATNLPGGGTGHPQVYLRDRLLQITTRVSVGPGNREMWWSRGSSISSGGRFVTMTMTDPTTGWPGVYLRDRVTETTTLVSVSGSGQPPNRGAEDGSVSDDGRYVAFASSSSNLVPNDTNDALDIFVRDRVAGTTSRISVSSAGTQGEGSGLPVYPHAPEISADGRYVAFSHHAVNLDHHHTSGFTGAFVRDLARGTTTRINVDSDEQIILGSAAQDHPVRMSADGRYFLFTVGSGDHMTYVRDVATGTTALVHDEPADTQGIPGADISDDGEFVAFSTAQRVLGSDTNDFFDVYRRHVPTRTSIRISRR